MRHFCENSDDLSSFGWREHNGRDFGRQELVENDMILETSFVKSRVMVALAMEGIGLFGSMLKIKGILLIFH